MKCCITVSRYVLSSQQAMGLFLCFLFIILAVNARAQTATNVIGTTGNIGIGTLNPVSKLQVVDNDRNYYVNRPIAGMSEDVQGVNYILLHEIYTGALMADRHVMGRITGIRGSAGAFNRKWTIEVNTSSAYNANKGSIISYNEMARLVTLVYNAKSYLAAEISSSNRLISFSFTGYAANEALQLVKDDDVTNVQIFLPTDPIGIQGNLSVGSTSSAARLDVSGGPLWTTNNWQKSVKLSNAGAIEFAGTYRSFGIGASGGLLFFSNANVNGTGGANYYMVADGNTGNMSIGSTLPSPNYKLVVEGAVSARRIKVQQSGWADYVFHPGYELPPLQEVENFVSKQQHLPGIPSEKEVKEEGLDLGEFDRKLLKKVEELTLYIIQLNKRVDNLNEQVATQQKIISSLTGK